MTDLSWALLVGLAFGLGIVTLLAGLRAAGPPPLLDRVALAVAWVSPSAREHLERRRSDRYLIVGWLDLIDRTLRRSTGTDAAIDMQQAIAARVARAGRSMTVSAYRVARLACACIAALVAVTASVLFVGFGFAPLGTLAGALLVAPLAAFLGGRAYDTWWSRAGSARVSRMLQELPTVMELLAISVAAGESVVEAIARVAAIGRGTFTVELASVSARVSAGADLTSELQRLAGRVNATPVEQLTEQLIATVQRGSAVAETLRAQAEDLRAWHRAELVRLAGRSEIAMLFPLVLLILPATAILALWPGLFAIRFGL